MKKIISILLTVIMMVLAVSCTGCSITLGPTEDELSGATDYDYIKAKGKLVIGITDFAPMDYKESGSDEWIGFDADYARAFCEYIGVEAEFVEIEWDNKELELDGKSIDCIWNGMTIKTPLKMRWT